MSRILIAASVFSALLSAQAARKQRIPRQTRPVTGAIEGLFVNDLNQGLGNVQVTIRNLETNRALLARTSGDGIFRIPTVEVGRYAIRTVLEGYRPWQRDDLIVRAGELVSVQVSLVALSAPPRRRMPEGPMLPTYRRFPEASTERLEDNYRNDEGVFTKVPDRWKFEWPEYRRYGPKDEAPYIPVRILDPYNRNKFKGDYPVIGQRTFLSLSATSDTSSVGRRLPIPSGVGSSDPDSPDFFGRGGQFALVQNFGFTFDLFRGDTAFRPIDWRIKITPEINLNYVRVKENGILNPDVRTGTTRIDSQIGLQEAFVEAKIKDLGHNYDFVSARLGTQTFNSDFRGFIFFDQEPGARIFGNFHANRYQYNAAYFSMLEKDTNSGLNTFRYRGQQVMIANLYRQDFLKPGYTIQVSYHFNKDDPSVRFDNNNFLVRPAPIGAVVARGRVQTNAIRAHYIGLAGDGHLGRWNVTHAFYQVLGHDTNNAIANSPRRKEGNRSDINAQMAAAEVSLDKDWIRYRASFFFASGDKEPQTGSARGFDAIVDSPNFAGGFFSFWNREGIRLTGTGLGLVQGNSLLPSLRTSKIQGQSNFVNPGIFIYNAGTDIEVTPKIRAVFNVNLMRFHHPEAIELALFQKPVHSGIGADTGVGVVYRPPLTENIVITGAFNVLSPFQGFSDIYNGKTLYSLAANVRFRF